MTEAPAREPFSFEELRNRGGDVVDRVQQGEIFGTNRAGKPVAELHPVRPSPVPLAVLLERRRNLPHVDPDQLRRDIDALFDMEL
ncbi:MAG: type II toxin-antitoxin system Phd/YefM family antitoxin [Angustibacter sp.]